MGIVVQVVPAVGGYYFHDAGMQQELLFDLRHKPVVAMALTASVAGAQTSGFGHATAPGLTVGFLRTYAVGAT